MAYSDLEGIPGVTDIGYIDYPGEKYEKARELQKISETVRDFSGLKL